VGCAPTVVTKCSMAAFTESGGLYFSSVSANRRASSDFWATIKLSFAKEMSRQVDWSSGPWAAEDGVVADDEADGVDDGVALGSESDGDVPLEQPAATITAATIVARGIRCSRIGHPFTFGHPFAGRSVTAIRTGRRGFAGLRLVIDIVIVARRGDASPPRWTRILLPLETPALRTILWGTRPC